MLQKPLRSFSGLEGFFTEYGLYLKKETFEVKKNLKGHQDPDFFVRMKDVVVLKIFFLYHIVHKAHIDRQ
jgi:hypothetical protein